MPPLRWSRQLRFRPAMHLPAPVVWLLLVSACSGDPVTDPAAPPHQYELRLESPSASTGITGVVGELVDPAPVLRLTADGRPVPGIRLSVTGDTAVWLNGSAVIPAVTDADGRAALRWTLGPVARKQPLTIRADGVGNGVVTILLQADARAGPFARVAAAPSLLAVSDSIPLATLVADVIPQDSFGNYMDPASLTVSAAGGSVRVAAQALIATSAGPGTVTISGQGTSIPVTVTVQPFRVTRLSAPRDLIQLGGTFPAVAGISSVSAAVAHFARYTAPVWATAPYDFVNELFDFTRSGVVWNARHAGGSVTFWRSTAATGWNAVPLPPGVTAITAINGVAGDTVFIVTLPGDSLRRFDGTTWTSSSRANGVVVVSGTQWIEYLIETLPATNRMTATRVNGATRTTLPPFEYARFDASTVHGQGVTSNGTAYLLFRPVGGLVTPGAVVTLAITSSAVELGPYAELLPRRLFVTPAGSLALQLASGFLLRNGASSREYRLPKGRQIHGIASEAGDRMLLSVTDWWGVGVLLVEPIP